MSGRDPNVIRLIQLGRTAAWQTQAVYHAMAETMTADSPDTIILCQPASPYLCLGYHQVYDDVVDRGECERRHLPVFRRQVGGGVTYLDSNQLFYQCVFHHSRVPASVAEIFARLLEAPVATLRRLGLDARLSQVNEIEVDGKRIAGTGGARIGEVCVVVGNILFDFDYDTMTQVWKVPWESFRDLASAALRDGVTTLRQLLGPVEIQTVESMLIEEYAKTLQRPLQLGKLSQVEIAHSRVVGERLQSPEYLGLHGDARHVRATPTQMLKISARVCIRADQVEMKGWRIQASFRVQNDVIEQARLESNPPRPWSDFESQLHGAPFQEWQRYLRIPERSL